jgi:hypothetical protein
LLIDLGLVGWVSFAEHGHQVSQCVDQVGDLLSGHTPATGRLVTQSRFGGGSLGLGLVDPGGDDLGAGARFECGPVLTQARVAVGDLLAGSLGAGIGRRHGAVLCGFEFPNGRWKRAWG